MISLIESQPGGDGVDLVQQVTEIFSPKGILSRSPNFEFRPQQQQMAIAVARALENREHLAVEAGTGVGKSLAYLIPAIRSGRRGIKEVDAGTPRRCDAVPGAAFHQWPGSQARKSNVYADRATLESSLTMAAFTMLSPIARIQPIST